MPALKSRAIYDALQARILAGELKPGQRLVLRSVAQEYGASDLPAREALRMLEQEGLVDIVPYSGARVTALSAERVLQAYYVRGHLEALATELATPLLEKSDLDELDELVEAMDCTLHDDAPLRYAELNRRFHTLIVHRCGNSFLEETTLGIWQTQTAFQVVFRLDPQRQAASNDEHRRIVAALRAGDAAAARDRALAHKLATAEALAVALSRTSAEVAAEEVATLAGA